MTDNSATKSHTSNAQTAADCPRLCPQRKDVDRNDLLVTDISEDCAAIET